MASQFTGNNSNRANTAFMIGFFTILLAWAFEVFGGYEPCELCLEQRIPYYVGLPLLAVIIGAWRAIPPLVRILGTLLVMGIFIWSAYMGAFHAGVEWGFWPGPSACTGVGEGMDFSDLGNIDENRVVMCDVVQFRFLGISFAGYNALISLLIAGFLGWSAWGQFRRMQAEKG